MIKFYTTFIFTYFISFLAYSQKITGVVRDEKGEPLIGVSVIEKGTLNGTISNFNGIYNLDLTTTNPMVEYSLAGYASTEENINGRSNIDVVLVEEQALGEVQVVGSRSYNRSATSSTAGIDVIDIQKVANTTGRVEINQVLQYTAPSFNATKQSGSDGADHIDPASLRGLGPDQTLVLINGKRRHQSSLINVYGTRGRGNTGTDLNAIPSSAIKRIEILRDGASAQYGSDAIAGVINIVLKDQKGFSGGVTYGAYSTNVGKDYEAQAGDVVYNILGKNRVLDKDRSFDGNTFKFDGNYGLSIGSKGGFANITAEYLTKDRTLRPGWSWRKGYGSAAVDQYQFMLNSAIPVATNTELVIFGGSGNRNTDAYAYSRDVASEDARTVSALYPNGFTPHITSNVLDHSASIGLKHNLSNGWKANLSATYGLNDFKYDITGTNNASLGPKSPTSFNAGGHSLGMLVGNLDFTKYFSTIASGMNVAFGVEHRNERFKIKAGEEASWATYDVNGKAITDPKNQIPFVNEFGEQAPGGAQGFPGYTPENVVNETRGNTGIYGDIELNASQAWLINTALRFENYSDFGSTFNYKLATRYKVSDLLAFRASYSTGFRAPSLAQIHYNLLFNDIVGGESLLKLLSSNTSPITRAFGINELNEEKSKNLAAGFTLKKGSFSATVDGYNIVVKDRIILTDIFDATNLNLGANAVQFFANGVDTKTTGIDIVLNYKKLLGSNVNKSINASIAANFNKTKIDKINNGALNEFTFFGPFSRAYLEAAAPKHKISANLGAELNKFDFQLTWTLFSEVKLQDYQWVDSPATSQEEANALYKIATDVYKSASTLDASISYNMNKNFRITVGANNLLNTYPTPQFDGWTDQGGFNDSVQMGSDGMFLFGRLGVRF